MSLPWSRSVHLRVDPGRISGVLSRGWPTPGRLAVAAHALEDPGPPDSGSTRALDSDQLEAVLQELELTAPVRGAPFDVEIADALVHFDVAEGRFATQTDRELHSIALACIGELLGEAAATHEVRWSLQPGGSHLFIAAVPQSFLLPLGSAAALRGSRLDRVQPSFCRQWNTFASKLTTRVAIFAVVCNAQVVVACVIDGAISGISVGTWLRPEKGAAILPGGDNDDSTPIDAGPPIERCATRLLASLGIDAEANPQYIVVTSDPGALRASGPWTVIQAGSDGW